MKMTGGLLLAGAGMVLVFIAMLRNKIDRWGAFMVFFGTLYIFIGLFGPSDPPWVDIITYVGGSLAILAFIAKGLNLWVTNSQFYQKLDQTMTAVIELRNMYSTVNKLEPEKKTDT